MKLIARLTAGLVLAFGAATAHADEYTLSVEPNYPPEQASQIYQPLLDYLRTATGHTFTLQVPRNYHALWRDMRAGRGADFVFEEAHFADFRATRHGYVPFARVAESTAYVVLVMPGSASTLRELIGEPLVSMPLPSLGAAILNEFYPNAVGQPDVMSVAASWRDGVEMIFSGEANAAIVPTHVAALYPNLEEVTRSRAFPGTAISASPQVPVEVREAVEAALLRLHEDPALFEVISELGASRFETTSAAEYRGSERALRGVFGYRENN